MEDDMGVLVVGVGMGITVYLDDWRSDTSKRKPQRTWLDGNYSYHKYVTTAWEWVWKCVQRSFYPCVKTISRRPSLAHQLYSQQSELSIPMWKYLRTCSIIPQWPLSAFTRFGGRHVVWNLTYVTVHRVLTVQKVLKGAFIELSLSALCCFC